MASWQLKNVRSLNAAAHRDVGYFCSTLVITYCLSGLALNHINDWNPDFIISKVQVSLGRPYTGDEMNDETIAAFGRLVGESDYKVYDAPAQDQIKIYYDNASLHIRLAAGTGLYERVSRRPIFYQSNLLHRNAIAGWKWVADVLAVMLILINLTGLFILKGKHGLSGRGKWLIAAGTLPLVIALAAHGL